MTQKVSTRTDDGRAILAGVDYLNARPLLDALESPRFADRFSLVRALPAEVARKLAEGEAALGLVPVAALAALGDLRLVRGMAIGATGPVRSVLLVSKVPFDRVETVWLDASSRTSVVLARLVLARLRKTPPRFVARAHRDLVADLDDRTAAVVIGDPALRLEGKLPHQIDLGQAWHEITGLPFVFAAWGARGDEPSVEERDLLREAAAEGLASRRAIAERAAPGAGVDATTAHAYLTEAIRYELGDAEHAGLQRFLDEAASAGLLPRVRARFLDDDATKARAPVSLDGLLSRAAEGARLSGDEAMRLYDDASLFDLGAAADAVRRRKHPEDVVTYIVDRNVNYTNVCTTSCRFCAFYRRVGDPEGYVLSREELGAKMQEVVDAGGVQILLQGGLNPDLPLSWYEELFRWMKSNYPLGLHALSPEEIWHLAKLEKLGVGEVLSRLHAAGLDSVPGGGAEILVDRVRRRIAKAKCTSAMWLEVMRVAHHMGLRSSATMMYGTIDTPWERVLHLLKLRELQDETGGFTAFFCWDYQHEQGTRIEATDGGTVQYLRTQAIGRLVLDNFDHVGASWVTQGPDVGELALRFGADDFGSVMFEENVVSSAGTTFRIDASAIERRIHGAGFRSVRRNVRYDWLTEPA